MSAKGLPRASHAKPMIRWGLRSIVGFAASCQQRLRRRSLPKNERLPAATFEYSCLVALQHVAFNMEANEVHYRQDGNPPDDLETSSLSPLLATSVAPQNRHEAIIKQIEGGLQHVNRLIRAPVLLKYGLNFALQSSAAVLNTSTSIKSTDNPAAASRASAEATRHLALILSDAPLDSTQF